MAHLLRSSGVGAESRVAVMLERSEWLVVALFGVWKAGAAYVPLDPSYPRTRLRHMVEDSGARLLVSRRTLADNAGLDPEEWGAAGSDAAPPRLVCLDEMGGASALPPDAHLGSPPAPPARPENLAYVIYTSGSTGRPKGVAITHASAAALLSWSAAALSPPRSWSAVLASTSICFDLSVFELFATLSRGGSVVLAESALDLPVLPAARRVTLVNTVPSAMAELVRLGAVPAGVRVVNLAGEALTRPLVERVYEAGAVGRVYNLYGPTEDTTYSTFAPVEQLSSAPVTIGRPVANTRAYVLDRGRRPVPVGVTGELYLGGAGLARGYLNRPALTAARFVPDSFSGERGARLYRTGDLVRYLPDGRMEYVGRIDQQVKVRGYRIELGEIEAALVKHAAVRECVVVAREAGAGDWRLVAYLVAEEGGAPSFAELREHVRERLPDYMVPAGFVTLAALPLTANGKVDRRGLPAAGVRDEPSGYVEPRGEIEEVVAQVWGEVLGVGRVGVRDNFFELGGHSLLATQTVSRGGVRSPFVAVGLQGADRSRNAAGLEGARRARRLPAIRPTQG